LRGPDDGMSFPSVYVPVTAGLGGHGRLGRGLLPPRSERG
jgi:hypothetical protein